jgi:hypothetical protein
MPICAPNCPEIAGRYLSGLLEHLQQNAIPEGASSATNITMFLRELLVSDMNHDPSSVMYSTSIQTVDRSVDGYAFLICLVALVCVSSVSNVASAVTTVFSNISALLA